MLLETTLLSGLYVTGVLAAQSPFVEVEFDRARDFSQYDSYSWFDSQEPAANSADHVRITKAIEEQLDEIGMSPHTSAPDVRIRYRLESENKKLHVTSRQKKSPWDPTDVETTVRLGDHREAVMVVEMFDGRTDALVWRARCTHRMPSPDTEARTLEETVERLFENYPTRSN